MWNLKDVAACPPPAPIDPILSTLVHNLVFCSQTFYSAHMYIFVCGFGNFCVPSSSQSDTFKPNSRDVGPLLVSCCTEIKP